MLIAIMNNTYTEVLVAKSQSAMNEKINILSDFRLLLDKLDLQMDFQYIFLIKPANSIVDDDSLPAQLSQVHKSVELGTEKVVAQLKARKLQS